MNQRDVDAQEWAADVGGLSRASEIALAGIDHRQSLSATTLAHLHAKAPTDYVEHLKAHAGVDGRLQSIPAADFRRTSLSEIALLASTPSGWLVARRGRGTLVSSTGERRVSLSPRALKKLGLNNKIDTVLLEPRLALERLSAAHIQSKSPWARLRAFLALERRDLWALVAYSVVLGGLSLAVPIAVQVLVNTIAFGSLMQPLAVLSLLLLGVMVLSGLIQVVQWYAVELLQRRIFVRLAEDFSRRLLTSQYTAHDRIHARELINRIFEVPTLQKTMGALLLDGLALTLQTLVGLLLLGFYHPALLAFDVVLILALVGVIALGTGAVGSAQQESAAKYATAAWLQAIAERPGVFKRPASALFAAQRSDALVRDYLSARRIHYRRVIRQLIGGVGLQIGAMVGLLSLGGLLVMRGELALGQLVAAELVVGVVGAGIAKLGKHLEKAYDLLASVDKVGKVVELPCEPMAPAKPQPAGLKSEPLALHLEKLEIGWSESRPLATLSATIEPGAKVQITTQGSVAGSLLAETLAGLRAATGSGLQVAGAASDQAQKSLRQRAHLVRPYDVVAGTIMDNLRLAVPALTEDDAWQALQQVRLEERVFELPQKLETPIWAAGGPLSREEHTRLCLARALLSQPDLVILDRSLEELGLPREALEEVRTRFLGPDAPWTAIVISDDPSLTPLCQTTLAL